jgi:hypothetical protein
VKSDEIERILKREAKMGAMKESVRHNKVEDKVEKQFREKILEKISSESEKGSLSKIFLS